MAGRAIKNDAAYTVSRRAQQMGPVWMEASHLTGMPIQNTQCGVLMDLKQQLAPELKRKQLVDTTEYLTYWGSMTDGEMAEVADRE